MTLRSLSRTGSRTTLVLALLIAPIHAAALLAPASALAADSEPCEASAVTAPVAAVELLDLAFAGVSRFPAHVQHDKNRGRAQEKVVRACLELDDEERALRYGERITNWRRGIAYAELAEREARRGEERAAREHLELADEVLREAIGAEEQEWRCERIQARIASAYLLLGDAEAALPYIRRVSPGEYDPIAITSAQLLDSEQFDDVVRDQEHVVGSGEFEVARASLTLLAELHGRFYADQERRARCEEEIRAAYTESKLPLDLRIDALLKLADHASEHADFENALRLVDEAQTIVEGARWNPQDLIPHLARLASARHRAGEVERARRDLANALALYDEDRELIYDIWRAETLRPVAEAYAVLGETERAHELYARAVEEGSVNPNARPRAEDLSESLCSMALHGITPSAELWKRVREIESGLVAPW